MRATWIAIAVVSLIFAGAASAAPSDRDWCRPKGGRILQANGTVEVWSARLGFEETRYVACHRKRRRPVALGRSDFYGGVGHIVVGGRFVAYVDAHCDRYGSAVCVGRLVVRDLKHGTRRRWTIPELEGGIWPVLLTRHGGVVWGHDLPDFDAPAYEIWALDRSGARRLATGAYSELDPASIAVSDDIAYWTQNGAARSAPVGPYG